MLEGRFEDIISSIHVDIPAELWVFFSNSRKDCRKMINGIDVVFFHDFIDCFPFGDVDEFEWAGVSKFRARLCPMSCGENIVITVFLSQGHG